LLFVQIRVATCVMWSVIMPRFLFGSTMFLVN
jgi:hypothetical protein